MYLISVEADELPDVDYGDLLADHDSDLDVDGNHSDSDAVPSLTPALLRPTVPRFQNNTAVDQDRTPSADTAMDTASQETLTGGLCTCINKVRAACCGCYPILHGCINVHLGSIIPNVNMVA